MTFTSLQEDMRNYLERGTTKDVIVFEQIPSLITLAEKAIATAIKVQGFLVPVTSSFVAGVSVYAKPNRWRETVSMFYGIKSTPAASQKNKRVPLYPRSYEYCRMYWPDASITDVENPPAFYADWDYQHWVIVPTPVETQPWEVNYYQLPPLLSDTNQTNWLTEYVPNMLLYRALLEATPFLKNDDRIPTWEKFYQEQLETVNQQDLKKVADREAVRSTA
jgi:hypothetical protein